MRRLYHLAKSWTTMSHLKFKVSPRNCFVGQGNPTRHGELLRVGQQQAWTCFMPMGSDHLSVKVFLCSTFYGGNPPIPGPAGLGWRVQCRMSNPPCTSDAMW